MSAPETTMASPSVQAIPETLDYQNFEDDVYRVFDILKTMTKEIVKVNRESLDFRHLMEARPVSPSPSSSNDEESNERQIPESQPNTSQSLVPRRDPVEEMAELGDALDKLDCCLSHFVLIAEERGHFTQGGAVTQSAWQQTMLLHLMVEGQKLLRAVNRHMEIQRDEKTANSDAGDSNGDASSV